MEKMLSSSDISKQLGISRDTALSIMRKMPHLDISPSNNRQCLRVTQADFDNWLAKCLRMPVIPRKAGRHTKDQAKPIPQVAYRHTSTKGGSQNAENQSI